MARLAGYAAAFYTGLALLHSLVAFLGAALLIRGPADRTDSVQVRLLMLTVVSFLNVASVAGTFWYSGLIPGMSLAELLTRVTLLAAAAILGPTALLFLLLKSRVWRIRVLRALCLAHISLWIVAVGVISRVESTPTRVLWLVLLTLPQVWFLTRPGRRPTETRPRGLFHDRAGAGLGLAIAALSVVFLFNGTSGTSSGVDAAQARRRDRPNVVIFCIDTLRADHCSSQGYPLGTTPALAELIESGATVFTGAVSQASYTVPSVRALFTSRPGSYFGLNSYFEAPPDHITTLPALFRAAGYETAFFSSNAVISGAGFKKGFQRFISWSGIFAANRFLALRLYLCRNLEGNMLQFLRERKAHYPEGIILLKLASRWLRRHTGKPFFLYVHLLDPHWPYYDHGLGMIPEAYRRDTGLDYTQLLSREPLESGRAIETSPDLGSPEFLNLKGRYDEEIRYSDLMFSLLLDLLKDLGLWDDTVFVATADHGEEFYDHGHFSHGHDIWEELIHIPLIIKWPNNGRFGGRRIFIDQTVGLIDIMPTLVDYIGVEADRTEMFGRSLLPLLESPDTPSVPYFSEGILIDQVRTAYRENNLKLRLEFSLHVSPAQSPKALVFDLDRDPGESQPLPADEDRILEFVQNGRRFWQEVWERWDKERSADLEKTDRVKNQLKALGYIR
jgi:arylsulfatase A-like enzyme